jgi:hypothetical protein
MKNHTSCTQHTVAPQVFAAAACTPRSVALLHKPVVLCLLSTDGMMFIAAGTLKP